MGIDLFCSIKDALPLIYANKDPLVTFNAYSSLSLTCKALFDILKTYRSDFARTFAVKPLFAKGLLNLENSCWMALARRQCLGLKNWKDRAPNVSDSKPIFGKNTSYFACERGLRALNLRDLKTSTLEKSKWSDSSDILVSECLLKITKRKYIDGYLGFLEGQKVFLFDLDRQELSCAFRITEGFKIVAIKEGKVFCIQSLEEDHNFIVYDLAIPSDPPKRFNLLGSYPVRFGATHLLWVNCIHDSSQLQFNCIEFKTLFEALAQESTPKFIEVLRFPLNNIIQDSIHTDGNDFIILENRNKFIHAHKVCVSKECITSEIISNTIPMHRGEYFYHEMRLFVPLIEDNSLTIQLFDLRTGENRTVYIKKLDPDTVFHLKWEAICPSRVHCCYENVSNAAIEIITFDYTR